MRKSLMIGSLLATFVAGAAFGEESMHMVRKAGDETRALLPIAIDATWTGRIPANAMKQGTPEMKAKGSQDCKWSPDGLWLVCDMKETMGEGKDAMKWRGHVMLGYDYLNKEYRSLVVDNMGASMIMNGKVDGNVLVLTSMIDMNAPDGTKCKGRITLDWTDPNAIIYKNEKSTDGGAFTLIEEATMKPTKKEKLPANT
jgi:hypothetical protein